MSFRPPPSEPVGRALACAVAAAGANDVPPNFPNPENLRIEGDALRRDAAPEAGGCNVYIDTGNDESSTPPTCLTTAEGATDYRLDTARFER